MKTTTLREPDPIQRHWPSNETPMSRLFALGPDALSDAEILAVLLRKGTKDRSAVDVAREVLAQAGGILPLFSVIRTRSRLTGA